MDTWEFFFREKSRRRSARYSREKAIKAAILSLFLASTAAAAWLLVAGVPR